jgi:hypothetical protein
MNTYKIDRVSSKLLNYLQGIYPIGMMTPLFSKPEILVVNLWYHYMSESN